MGSSPSKGQVSSKHGSTQLSRQASKGSVHTKGSHTHSDPEEVNKRISKARQEAGVNDDETDQFHDACMSVFENADVDGSGSLDQKEFLAVLRSKTLNLNLSDSEIEEVRKHADLDGDGLINYREFIQVIKNVLQKVYEKNEVDWNDWCQITNTKTGAIVYMNKRTGAVQQEQPAAFHPERVDERTFEHAVLEDGTELTMYTTERGERMFLDWETKNWEPFPEEWISAIQSATIENVEAKDDRSGEFVHPSKGTMMTYLYENTRNTRLYFDTDTNQWERMPLLWESQVADVLPMVEELDRAFPQWKNVREQVLALRECNYDLADTIAFIELNWSFGENLGSTMFRRTSRLSMLDTLSKTSSRSSLNLPRGGAHKDKNMTLRPVSENGGVDIVSEGDALNRTSTPSGLDESFNGGCFRGGDIATVSHIRDLEQLLAQQEAELQKLREEISDAPKTYEVLKKEKSHIEQQVKQKENSLQEAQTKATLHQEEIASLKTTIAHLESDLLVAKADKETIVQLQKELTLLTTGQEKESLMGALKEKEDTILLQRDQITELKVAQRGLQEVADNPLRNAKLRVVLSDLFEKLSTLQKDKAQLRKEVTNYFFMFEDVLTRARKASKNLTEYVTSQVEEITAKYRAEALQRRLLYNKVQELRGNIRVFIRCRKDSRDEEAIMRFPNESEIILPSLKGEDVSLEFDRTYGTSTEQLQVFEDTRPTIMSVVDGYNVCIIAYGQTGSGKTHTMMGTLENPGVNRRAVKELLDLCSSRTELDYTITISLVEIYNETIYDLLNIKDSDKLQIHQGPAGVYLPGLTERKVTTQADVEKVMAEGDRNRTTAATAMNAHSSRSHLLLQLNVVGYNKISHVTSTGKLTLVDLAGSERVSKTEASGQRLVEAAAINKSLSSLGQVFKALASNSPHIPYRNSKLTHLLQDSLGGDSKTCVFINISPLRSNLSETHSALNFGKAIGKIELGPAKKNTSKPPPPALSH